MLSKISPTLLAALMAMAGPALAQTAAPSTAPAETPAPATPAAPETAPAAATDPGAPAGAGQAAGAMGQPADPTAQATTVPGAGAGSAVATGAAAPAAPAAETGTAPAPDGVAATGAAPAGAPPAAAEGTPQVGQYYVRSTHTDWTLRCIKAQAGGVDPCELYQLMKDQDGNSVAEMTMIPLEGEVAAGATMVAPLETDLLAAITLRIDSAQPRVYPFNFCTQVGCVSRLGFTSAEVTSLKRGNKATVTLLPFGGDPKDPVNLNLSLAGFTAAMDELSKLAQEAKNAPAPAPAAEAPATAPATEAPAADAPAATPPASN